MKVKKNSKLFLVDLFLFDLDGTLVDSAPDLAFALNQVLEINNKPPKDFKDIRKLVSFGGKKLIEFGFEIDETDKKFNLYHQQLLTIYQKNIAQFSTLFIDREFLDSLNKWGIVTNKPTNLTNLLLKSLNLNPSVVVCGDSLSENKPSSKPIEFALKKLGIKNINKKNIAMVGDDIVDIQAGNSAGITTIAVNYGYGMPKDNWKYDFLINSPKELYQFKI